MTLTSKPRVLYICGLAPCPPDHGYKLRILNIGCLLQKQASVRLVVVPREQPNEKEFEQTKVVFGDFDCFLPLNKPNKTLMLKIRRLLDRHWVAGRDVSISVKDLNCIEKLRIGYDIIWIHSLTVADRLGKYSWTNSVLDIDDLSSQKHKQQMTLAPGLRNKAKEIWRANMRRRWERDILNRFTLACVCSDIDRASLSNSPRVFVLPNGIEPPAKTPARRYDGSLKLGFIGTLAYGPNIDGVNWFIKRILPRIARSRPGIRFRVVGHILNNTELLQHPNVDYLGFIDDPIEEISTWCASIVPLRIGAGTRIKILDAFRRKCPVISTTVGAYGLDVINGKHLMVADSEQEFAERCIELLKNPEVCERLADSAWRLLQEKYLWQSMTSRIEQILEFCLRSKL